MVSKSEKSGFLKFLIHTTLAPHVMSIKIARDYYIGEFQNWKQPVRDQ